MDNVVRSVAHVSASGSVEINQWNSFYATEIEATFRFVGAFVVIAVGLYILSGLTSGFLVGTTAVEWDRRALRSGQLLGPVLMIAAAALLPIYAMFQPFDVHDIVGSWAWAMLLGILATLFLLFFIAPSGSLRKRPDKDFIKSWWQFLAALLVLLVAGTCLWFTALDAPRARLVMSYVILATLSIVTTAASYGQSRRLTVEAKSGSGKSTHDDASTEYLLARLQTLGLEHQRTLHFPARQRKLGALATADLSGTPAGQIAAVVARFAFAVRPDLAWRATVAFVDDDRLAMTISRNGRFCDIDAFSRQDIGLSPIDRDDPASVDRARAQLLTGAAAFVLRRMSDVYPSLRDGLCGATLWRSIALQVIATSASLSGNAEDPIALLRLATNLDPDNLRARHEYIRALTQKYDHPPFDASIADRLDELYSLLEQRDPLRPGARPKIKHKALALLILYDSAVNWFNVADRRQQGDERTQHLARAKNAIRLLRELCEDSTNTGSSDIKQAVKMLGGHLSNLDLNVEALEKEPTGRRPADCTKAFSPALAYNYACFEAHRAAWLQHGTQRDDVLKQCFSDLSYAVSTGALEIHARDDECFTEVRGETRFIAIVGPRPPDAFVDLEPYRPFKQKLSAAGFDSALRFAAGNAQRRQRDETAAYLGVPTATVDWMYNIADLGAIHEDLADPRMLFLLLTLKVESRKQLREKIDSALGDFQNALRAQAARHSVPDLPGAGAPYAWVGAV